MTDIANITWQEDHAGIDWQELEALFALAQLHGREKEKLRRAFLNSPVVCYAYDAGRLVGAARALTDGEYHATIYDVAVHPDYQRHGLGTQLMRRLLARLRVWRVMLVASADVQPFYARLGFVPYDDVMARLDWDALAGSAADG